MATLCSVFQQILKLFPRGEFAEVVRRHQAERHARGFSSWQQFVAMLFCQLGRAQSLREICDGLRSIDGKLRHLGIDSPKRSTLAYANEHRPWQVSESIFHRLLGTIRADLLPKHRFRFKNPLVSLDSTIIELCIEVFDWARYKQQNVIAVVDQDGTTMEFFTNHDRLAARTIAAIYKQRWQIETFFKAIKQNLRIKSFVGTSANAVATQVWTV